MPGITASARTKLQLLIAYVYKPLMELVDQNQVDYTRFLTNFSEKTK